MNLKKFVAGMTALLCCTGTLAFFPEFVQTAHAETAVSNDFEISYGGWYGNADSVILTAENQTGFENSRGMLVSGRESVADGASSSKGFYLYGGVNYHYSVKVFSQNAETFRLSLLCIDQNTGEETVKELAVKNSGAGEWTELSADYTAPDDSYEFKLTITTDSTNDFIFDDVKITSEDKNLSAMAASTEKGLKDEFAGYFKVGNILNGGTVQNSAITANILKDCNSVECENEMKPDATLNRSQCNGTDIAVSLNSAAAIMDFCSQNGISMRGHTFVWHSQTPAWFFKTDFSDYGAWVDTNTMDARMESYIKNMFSAIKTQYPNLDLYAYDVCNECISDNQQRTANNGGAREPGDNNVEGGKSAWVQVYGDNSFVEKAFTYARKYAPAGCDLYYNDYNEYWDHKRDCIYNMCKSLYQKGLLDGVGMQSHIPANATGFAGTDSYIEAMQKYLSIGCDVQITELDISLNGGEYSLQDQANKYKAIFQAAVDWNKNPKSDGRVTAVCIWGPNDANSWLKEGSDALLYDKNNQPKLAYTTLMSMIPESEWGDGAGEVKPAEPNEYGWYFNDGFEDSTCDWTGRGSASISTSGRTAFVGSESLLVQDRTSAWNGAAKILNPKVFIPDNEYSFSAIVNYFDGSATDTFYLKLQYTDASGETQYATIAEATGVKGEWVQLANTNYKIPADASDMQLYIETAETTNNFYIDEVIGAVAGTGIKGPDPVEIPTETTVIPAPSGTKGDLNNDGKINIYDFLLAKKGLISGFTDAQAKNAADVDRDGNVTVADIVQIHKYLMGQIKNFTVVENPVQESGTAMSMSEFTALCSAKVSEFETADSKQEKAGVQYGTIKSGTYYSETCKRNKPYNILLPANYDENKKYPVLYVMHGYWENQNRMIIEGNGTMYTRQIIGNAIASGEAEDMIVVFPYIYSSDSQDACSGMDDFNNAAYDNFINDLTKDLMPHIESTYSVKTGRDNTAITGFSMGGREALLIGMQRSDLFGYVGAICPAPGVTGAFSWDAGKEPYLLMITGGSNDTVVYNNPETYHNNFAGNNVPHIWHYVNGGYHGDNSIHAHLYNFCRFVFKATK